MSITSHWKALNAEGLETILDDLNLLHVGSEFYSTDIPALCTITHSQRVSKNRLGGGKILFKKSYYINVKGVGAGNYIFDIEYTLDSNHPGYEDNIDLEKCPAVINKSGPTWAGIFGHILGPFYKDFVYYAKD